MKVLVTGGTGFVGRTLVPLLLRDGHAVRLAVRDRPAQPPTGCEIVVNYALEASGLPLGMLDGCEAVVHAAARVHRMGESPKEAEELHRLCNSDATARLALEAAAAGVRRFVLISSVKAQAERSPPDRPLREDDPAVPHDAYGRSKLQAERMLRDICTRTAMEYVIVRPPLVYGAGVSANFRALAEAVLAGRWLPLGRATKNRRSYVSAENLADFVRVCLTHQAAAGQVFLVSDGEDLSTAELVRRMAQAAGRRPRLIPLPPALLRLGLVLAGRTDLAARLLGDLRVDCGKARTLLGWVPPLGIDAAMRATMLSLTT